tara:strand:+ start:169 stop:396 length:228 start_codon:yes stop_codon:yes gene_type:complete
MKKLLLIALLIVGCSEDGGHYTCEGESLADASFNVEVIYHAESVSDAESMCEELCETCKCTCEEGITDSDYAIMN